jgi:hypothetical protein
MGIFTTPPQLPSDQLDGLTPPDFTTTGQQLASGAAQVPWYLAWIPAIFQYAMQGLSIVLASLFNALEYIMSFGLKLFTNLQGAQGYGFAAFVAAMMEDLLWVPVDASVFAQAFSQGGRIEELEAVGGSFIGTLSNELSGAHEANAIVPGLTGAGLFLGFLIEFAVREGNIGFFSELLPEWLPQFKGLRDYGENLANNLGLGRLARRALQPLIQMLVTIPMQWSLNAQYTPTLYGVSELIHGFNNGLVDAGVANNQLAYHGYPQSALSFLQAEYGWKMAVHDALNLERGGTLDRTQLTSNLAFHGIKPVDAVNWYQSGVTGAVVSVQSRALEYLLLAARLGGAQLTNFVTLVNSMELLPEEKQAWISLASLLQSTPHHTLSLAQLEEAFIEGLITFSDLEAGFQAHGYGPQDVTTLGLMTLIKQQKATKTTTGTTGKKHVSEAELVKAYNANIITIDQFTAGLTNLGYPPDDIAILTALAQGKTGTPGNPVLGGVNPT